MVDAEPLRRCDWTAIYCEFVNENVREEVCYGDPKTENRSGVRYWVCTE